MKTITVEEAARDLGRWLQRAWTGEEIAIVEGRYIVLLQPVPTDEQRCMPRDALAKLQSSSQLKRADAHLFLREVHSERKATP